MVTFLSEADREEYLPHPAHEEFLTVMKPHLDKGLVIDYWTKSKGKFEKNTIGESHQFCKLTRSLKFVLDNLFDFKLWCVLHITKSTFSGR